MSPEISWPTAFHSFFSASSSSVELISFIERLQVLTHLATVRATFGKSSGPTIINATNRITTNSPNPIPKTTPPCQSIYARFPEHAQGKDPREEKVAFFPVPSNTYLPPRIRGSAVNPSPKEPASFPVPSVLDLRPFPRLLRPGSYPSSRPGSFPWPSPAEAPDSYRLSEIP